MADSPALVQLQEVPAIVGQQDAAIGGCEGQYLGIRHGRVCFSSFPGGESIVAQTAQFHHHLECDILVGIKTGH